MWVSKGWLKEKQLDLDLRNRALDDKEARIHSQDQVIQRELSLKASESKTALELLGLEQELAAAGTKFEQMENYYSTILQSKDSEIAVLKSTIDNLISKIQQPKDATFNQSIVK